jgi:hypothetical protein
MDIGNITKMKPGLTWLMARGSVLVPGDTNWNCWGDRSDPVLEEYRDIGTGVG